MVNKNFGTFFNNLAKYMSNWLAPIVAKPPTRRKYMYFSYRIFQIGIFKISNVYQYISNLGCLVEYRSSNYYFCVYILFLFMFDVDVIYNFYIVSKFLHQRLTKCFPFLYFDFNLARVTLWLMVMLSSMKK